MIRPARKALVAFQGERGAFSEEAARQLLGAEAGLLPCPRFEDVFRSLQEGAAAGAVIPIENSLAGSVHESQLCDLDQLHDSGHEHEVAAPLCRESR